MLLGARLFVAIISVFALAFVINGGFHPFLEAIKKDILLSR